MDYNIHLHLPGGSESGQANAHSGSLAEGPRNRLGVWYESFLKKVGQCYNWRSLYELANDFHQLGLTIHKTNDGRRVLCRLEEGRPVTKKIIDDYVFVGSNLSVDEEVSERAMEVITHFIEANASKPQKLVTDGQNYSKYMSLYGDPLRLCPGEDTVPAPAPSNPCPVPPQREFVGEDHELDLLNQEIELIGRLLS